MIRPFLAAAMIASAACLASADEPTKSKADPVDKPATRESSKDRVQRALLSTAEALRSRSIEESERAAFAELLAAAEALRNDESVPQHERDRWRGLARVRLAEGVEVLRRQVARANAAPARLTTPPAGATVLAQFPAPGAAAPSANTKADVVEAEKLIEIITGAIRPETWQDNGGQGTIRYWSLGHALIIYNTADVHERIGGFAGQLRP